MSTIEDHLRKLGDGWDKEDLEHTEDAIERYLMFLNDFRTLLFTINKLSPENILENTWLMTNIAYRVSVVMELPIDTVLGFLLCLLLVEIEKSE